MLKKITNIKDFGVFTDFRGNNLPGFSAFNLIFGWNYSGKTTLSRVFRCLEVGEKHPDYPNSSFSFLDHEDKEHSLKSGSNYYIRVFNEDFKEANFSWSSGQAIRPILLLGAENIELSASLSKASDEKNELEKSYKKILEHTDVLSNNLSAAETDCGNQIARELRLPRFNKTNLRPIFASWDGEVPASLSEEEFSVERERFQSIEQREELKKITLQVNSIDDLWESARSALDVEPTGLIVLQNLANNPTLANWIEQGLEIHAELDNCEFCSSKITDKRRGELRAHFSDAFREYKKLLASLIVQLKSRVVVIDAARYVRSAFFPEFHEKWTEAASQLKDQKDAFNASVEAMSNALELKLDNPFEAVRSPEKDFDINLLNAAIGAFNKVIEAHNDRVSRFSELKRQAQERLISHYASEAMSKIDRFGTLQKLDEFAAEKTVIQQKLSELQSKIESDKAKLSDAAKGAGKVNAVLYDFFGKDDLQITVNSEENFEITRRGNLAKNLSEGERTAISFCYFIVKLYEESDNFEELIVYIDDPISSLDSNHLMHVNALIKNTFYKFDSEAEKSKRHKCLVKQLFISTHNYEFFHLVWEWMDGCTKGTYEAFYIQREDSLETVSSNVVRCPAAFTKYRSEYLFLFLSLQDFISKPVEDLVVLFNLGNMCRRFLERYFLFKYVSVQKIDQHINSLIPNDVEAERVRKFSHFYSHSLKRGASAPLPDLNEALAVLSIIFSAIEQQDKLHYDAMIAAIQSEE